MTLTRRKHTDAMACFFRIKRYFLTSILSGFILVFAIQGVSYAATVRDIYGGAEACYKKIRHSSEKKKNRNNWLVCIKKFQAVYQYNPKGPWAAAGLYMSGKLYWELYQQSFHNPDKEEAIDIFERIIKRFPKSGYRKKALDFIRLINQSKGLASHSVKAGNPRKFTAKDKYNQAETCYGKLLANSAKQKYRDQWLSCIQKFDAVFQHDPSGPWAAAGLYMTGVLYEGLFKHSFNSLDRKKALDIYNRIISDYPKSRYKQKAASMRSKLCGSDSECDSDGNDHPLSGTVSPSRDRISPAISAASESVIPDKTDATSSNGLRSVVNGIRYWSNQSYTRIVIDADRDVTYSHHLLKKDPSIKKPPRLYIDLNHSRLGKGIKRAIPIDDNLLSGVRAAQHTRNTVRVVIDIKSFKTYKIFPLREPFRIVVDVWGATIGTPAKTSQDTLSTKGKKIPAGALAKQLALGVSRVVIDPGHGGKDPGAPGYLKNVYEKDVTLKIAKMMAKKIKKTLQCEVILTRNSDRYLTLEERTAFANTKNADLFISIHANAHINRRIYGIETFYLNLATDDEAIRVAARENATSAKNISDLHSILSDLMQNAKINESSRLAAYVQESMCHHMKVRYKYIKNKGVKQAPFYVLLGAQMPSILIETSFISNSRECKRLIDTTYQQHLCDAIVKGIQKYIRETSPNKM